jgi:hypothetical protein
MVSAMREATKALGGMNRNMNLPGLQRIAMEFEKENDIMDQRQEVMDEAIDDVTGLEDEAEGDEIVDRVLEEIGVDLKYSVSDSSSEDITSIMATDICGRWVKHLKDFKIMRWRRVELRKLLVGGVLIRETMIFKPGLTA